MAGTQKRDQGTVWLSGMLDMLKGGTLGAGILLVVLGVAAWLIWLGVFGSDNGNSAVIAACLAGSFVGGVFVVRRRTLAPLTGGLCTGAVLFLLLLTAGVAVCDAMPSVHTGGVEAGACLCGGGLAGVLGRGGGKKRRKR